MLGYFTAQQAINEARNVYLNDASGQRYTDARMFEVFKSNYDIILLKLVEADVPCTKTQLQTVVIAASNTSYELDPALTGSAGMLPIRVRERPDGATLWSDMIEQDWTPLNLTPGVLRGYWRWGSLGMNDTFSVISFPEATGGTEFLIDLRVALTTPANAGVPIKLPGLRSYFAARLAAIASSFIGNNPSRAEQCESIASQILQTYMNIQAKKNQSLPRRHKPFNYRKRTGWRFWV